jgi:hypothetical protein
MIRKKKISALMGAKFEGSLDKIGNVSSCVLAYAPYKRLTKNYNDYLVLVVRVDDLEEKYFYADSNGDIDSTSVDGWLGSSSGAVKKVANQVKVSNEAYQNTLTNMPLISSSGTFESKGLLYDNTNDYLIVDDYSEIDIQDPLLSLYVNYEKINSHTGMVFSKNYLNFTATQYGLYTASDGRLKFMLNGGPRVLVNDGLGGEEIKAIATWRGTGTDEVILVVNDVEDDQLYASSLTSRQNNTIGADQDGGGGGYLDFFNGNIKTVLIFSSDEYGNYSKFVSEGL